MTSKESVREQLERIEYQLQLIDSGLYDDEDIADWEQQLRCEHVRLQKLLKGGR